MAVQPQRDSINEVARLALQKYEEAVGLLNNLRSGANVPSSVASAASTAFSTAVSSSLRANLVSMVAAVDAVIAGGDNSPNEKRTG